MASVHDLYLRTVAKEIARALDHAPDPGLLRMLAVRLRNAAAAAEVDAFGGVHLMRTHDPADGVRCGRIVPNMPPDVFQVSDSTRVTCPDCRAILSRKMDNMTHFRRSGEQAAACGAVRMLWYSEGGLSAYRVDCPDCLPALAADCERRATEVTGRPDTCEWAQLDRMARETRQRAREAGR